MTRRPRRLCHARHRSRPAEALRTTTTTSSPRHFSARASAPWRPGRPHRPCRPHRTGGSPSRAYKRASPGAAFGRAATSHPRRRQHSARSLHSWLPVTAHTSWWPWLLPLSCSSPPRSASARCCSEQGRRRRRGEQQRRRHSAAGRLTQTWR